jgi:predicted MPP superfamily phosphohydrolase
MKTLIVSDIHLTHVFDERKFLFLKELFSSFEKIILNGDFWDGHSTTFERFIASPWNALFPLLKSKGAIYLYGNHDLKEFSDERVSLFSVESGYTHTLKIESDIYHVEHGNMLYPSIDEVFHFSRKILQCMNTIAHRVEHGLASLGSPHNFILKRANSIIKRRLKIKKFPLWYLCGHTHFAEFDRKNKFANSGFIQYGKATYLIADSSGLSLRTEWYK